MGNAASGLPFVVGEEISSYPESQETCSWRLHSGTKRVSTVQSFSLMILRHPSFPETVSHFSIITETRLPRQPTTSSTSTDLVTAPALKAQVQGATNANSYRH